MPFFFLNYCELTLLEINSVEVTVWTNLILHLFLKIKPLVEPTKDIMKLPIHTFQWHEFFPKGNYVTQTISAVY